MKFKYLIISACFLVVMLVAGIALYCAWPAITGTITDSKYYTSEEVQEAYDKGFEDGCVNFDELTGQVDYYKELTDTYYISILDYQKQISDYEVLTDNNRKTITALEQNKTELQTQVDNLTLIKNSNEITIQDLQIELADLENQLTILTNSDSSKAEEIAELNTQITNLNSLITQLQNTNTLNVNTIVSLNAQINNLNGQISEMTIQNQNVNNQITVLNNKIADLQKSINYYEEYIDSLETGEQVVITFEFDNSVYNIQIINKNSSASVVTPTSTDYVVFNYWTVNGEQIDLTTYQFDSNTKVVADVTYKYDVKFMVDNKAYDTQIVVENGFVSVPENPTKTGYEFDGWSLNGVDVLDNISTTAVTQNVSYQAVFTKLHTVTFLYEDQTISTQEVRNGEYANNVEVEDTVDKVFDGWLLNDNLVDVNTIVIYADTTFVADITYYYNVGFMSPETGTQRTLYVQENSLINTSEIDSLGWYHLTNREGYDFDGFTIGFYGSDFVDFNTYIVTGNIQLYAHWTKLYTVTFVVDGSSFGTEQVRDGEIVPAPEQPTKQGYEFVGWSIDGTTVVDVSDYIISSDTTFVAVFEASTGVLNIDTGEVIISWEDLIDGGYFKIGIDGELSADYSVLQEDSSIYGQKLVIDGSVERLSNIVGISHGVFSEVVVPGSIKNIPANSFNRDTCLKKIVLLDGVTTIASGAFESCNSLETVILPDSLTVISSSVFKYCHSLTNIDFGSGVSIIEEYAFQSCGALKNVVLPSSLTTIEKYAFYSCSGLEAVYIPSSITTIEHYAFDGCPYSCILYSDASMRLDGWGVYFDSYESRSPLTSKLTVKYGYSYEQYLAEIGV